jgi:hypothetical protein
MTGERATSPISSSMSGTGGCTPSVPRSGTTRLAYRVYACSTLSWHSGRRSVS